MRKRRRRDQKGYPFLENLRPWREIPKVWREIPTFWRGITMQDALPAKSSAFRGDGFLNVEGIMLVELITPLMLATAPMTIDVPKSTYDHKAQTSTSNYKKLAFTMNGTQTFDFNGRPRDADNDN
jgi:hypothetical protein